MRLDYEPSSEPVHNSTKQSFINQEQGYLAHKKQRPPRSPKTLLKFKGLGFQAKVLERFKVGPFSLGSGTSSQFKNNYLAESSEESSYSRLIDLGITQFQA